MLPLPMSFQPAGQTDGSPNTRSEARCQRFSALLTMASAARKTRNKTFSQATDHQCFCPQSSDQIPSCETNLWCCEKTTRYGSNFHEKIPGNMPQSCSRGFINHLSYQPWSSQRCPVHDPRYPGIWELRDGWEPPMLLMLHQVGADDTKCRPEHLRDGPPNMERCPLL